MSQGLPSKEYFATCTTSAGQKFAGWLSLLLSLLTCGFGLYAFFVEFYHERWYASSIFQDMYVMLAIPFTIYFVIIPLVALRWRKIGLFLSLVLGAGILLLFWWSGVLACLLFGTAVISISLLRYRGSSSQAWLSRRLEIVIHVLLLLVSAGIVFFEGDQKEPVFDMNSPEPQELKASKNRKTSDRFWLQHDGSRMPVLVEGNTSSNLFIVFLHGGPAGGSIFINRNFPEITDRIEREYAMVLWDQRGVGGASKEPTKARLNKEQYVRDLEKLVELLTFRYGKEIQLVLLGHSWGGILGQSFLVRHPNHPNIAGWIESGSGHSILKMIQFGQKRFNRFSAEEIRQGRNVEQWQALREKHEAHCACEDGYQALVDHFQITIPAEWICEANGLLGTPEQAGNFSLGKQFIYSVREFVASDEVVEDTVIEDFSAVNLTGELYQLAVPTLFIFGKYDFETPVESAYDALQYYGTPAGDILIKEFEHSGHAPMAHEPERFQKEVLEFIKSNVL